MQWTAPATPADILLRLPGRIARLVRNHTDVGVQTRVESLDPLDYPNF